MGKVRREVKYWTLVILVIVSYLWSAVIYVKLFLNIATSNGSTVSISMVMDC